MTTKQYNQASNSALWPDDLEDQPRPEKPAPETAPTPRTSCPFAHKYDGKDCWGGVRYRGDPRNGQDFICPCVSYLDSIAALPPELRAALPTEEHKDFLRTNMDALLGVVGTRAARDEVLAVAKLLHVNRFFQSSSDVEVASDRDVVAWQKRTWDDGYEGPTFDEAVMRSKLLIITLGEMTKGWDEAPLVVRDALRLRINQTRSTWVVFDGPKPWILTQPQSGALIALLKSLPSIAWVRPVPSPQPETAVAVAQPTDERPLSCHKAMSSKDQCVVCGKMISRGVLRIWANRVDEVKWPSHLNKVLHATCYTGSRQLVESGR